MASSTSYSSPGTYTFTLPANIDVNTPMTLDLSGAWGGADGGNVQNPQAGGRVVGTLNISAMTPGVSTITVTVGGQGGAGANPSSSGNRAAGGSNGGGQAGDGSTTGASGQGGGGGGGATDVRVGGTGLANRVAVAGGSGGCGASGAGVPTGGTPGKGGAATGQAGQVGGSGGGGGGGGGTAAAGGAAGSGSGSGFGGGPGTSGQGGGGGRGPSFGGEGGGGGGGGYFGGGGGGGANNDAGAGGGGSNYVGGLIASTVNSQGGSLGAGAGAATLSYNLAPNQPTVTAHANGDDTTGVKVNWTFSDPDPADTQSRADVRWRVGAGAWTTVSPAVTGSAGLYTFAANTFQTAGVIGQSVEFQVRTYDAAGMVGPWSVSSFCVPRRESTTAPTLTLPAGLNSTTPQFTITSTVPFRYVRVVVQDTVTLATYDFSHFSGLANGWLAASGGLSGGGGGAPGGDDTAAEVTSVTLTLPYDMPFAGFAYVNGRNYTFTAYTSDISNAFVPSAVSAGVTVASAVGSPLTPSLAVNPDPTSGSIGLAITNPGSDPFPPVRNEIWRTDLDHNGAETRIAASVAVGGTFVDWQAPTNTNVRYRVAAVSAAGNKAYST